MKSGGAGMTNIEKIESALQYIPSGDRDTWLQVGMAIQSELGDAGFSIWDTWSQSAENYSSRDVQSTWKSFSSGGGINIGSLFYLAGQNGWKDEASTTLNNEEKIHQAACREAQKKQREAEQEKIHGECRKKAKEIWSKAISAPEDHPYLIRKGVKSHGLREHKGSLVIPVRDGSGTIHGLQFIDDSGKKNFLTGTAKKGHYFSIGGKPESVLYLAEGYATAATIHEATGEPVAVCFDAGNLKPVAEILRAKLPSIQIVLCADNDSKTEGNPGLTKSTEAALAIDGLIAVPEFQGNTPGTDFNDLAAVAGLEEVKRQIEAATEPEQEADKEESLDQLVERLAKLSPLEYDRKRKEEANKVGVRPTTLDAEVNAAREREEESANNFFRPDDEPWDEPVNGTELLNELSERFTSHSILPPGSAEALALWTVLTYCFDSFSTLPILAILSPEKRCGKTTTLETLAKLCLRALPASNISSAAIYRVVEAVKPCLLIDEADTFLKSNEELRGIINAGHTRTAAFVIKCVGEKHEVKPFSTWGPKAIAMIGKLPDTVGDRAVIVPLRRKLAGETVKPHRESDNNQFSELRRKIVRFTEDNHHRFNSIDICNLKTSNDRGADNWKPLLIIAASAGEEWEAKARDAAHMLMADSEGDDVPSIMLLGDIRSILNTHSSGRIASKTLVLELTSLEDRPWCEWKKGRPMTQNSLAKLLKPFGIKSKKIRFGETTAMGYKESDFSDAFMRYLPDTPIQSGTPEQVSNIDGLDQFQSGTQKNNVPFQEQLNYAESLGCSIVPFQKWVGGGINTIKLSEADLLDDSGKLFGDVS